MTRRVEGRCYACNKESLIVRDGPVMCEDTACPRSNLPKLCMHMDEAQGVRCREEEGHQGDHRRHGWQPWPNTGKPFEIGDIHATGIGRTVAFAIGAIDLEHIRRSTIRSLLPEGSIRTGGRKTKNRTSEWFGNRLRTFEERGWIKRSELTVQVLNRHELLTCALGPNGELAEPLLRVVEVARQINEEVRRLDRSHGISQAERELMELKRLMEEAPFGANGSGRRNVRIVNKSRVI